MSKISLVAASEEGIGFAEAGHRWRQDLDPGALPPTPRRSPGQRRVLRASLVHFAHRGYGGSNIRDIASTLGIQAASVYKHFESKEAILAELVHLGYDFHRQATVAATLGAPSEPEAQLEAFIRTHVRVHCDYPRLVQVARGDWAHLSPEALSAVEQMDAQSSDVLRVVLDRGCAAGVFAIPDVELTVIALTGLGVSAAQWFPYQAQRSADEVADAFASTALKIVRLTS